MNRNMNIMTHVTARMTSTRRVTSVSVSGMYGYSAVSAICVPAATFVAWLRSSRMIA